MFTNLKSTSPIQLLLNTKVSLGTAALVALVLVVTTYIPKVNAWGQNGHRIVGQIALNHLTPVALEKVLALLSGDRLPEVTTWADEMRSNPDEFWKYQSSKWHYISINKLTDFKPEQYDFPFSEAPKDIYSAILKNITVLQDKSSSQADKEFNLRFLTHLVGDLHMPLHVGRSEDRGGNRIKVKYFGKETNLHSLWDTALVESQNLSYKDFADFIETKDQQVISKYLNSGVQDWVTESYEFSQHVYNVGDGDFGYDYNYKNVPIVKTQLLKAGIRLAGVLNLIFDPASEPGKNAVTKIQ